MLPQPLVGCDGEGPEFVSQKQLSETILEAFWDAIGYLTNVFRCALGGAFATHSAGAGKLCSRRLTRVTGGPFAGSEMENL